MCAHRLPNAPVVPLRKLHSLGAADVRVAISALEPAITGWTLDQHRNSDGDLMLMITPPGHVETTPTFVLSFTVTGVQLDVALGDSCDSLGTFANVRQGVVHARHIMTTSTADTVLAG